MASPDPFAAYVIRDWRVRKVVVNPVVVKRVDYWCTADDGSFQEYRPQEDLYLNEQDARKALRGAET